jgi:hypothetical protein
MIISVVSPGNPETIDTLFSSLKYEAIKDETSALPTFLTKIKPEAIDKSGGGSVLICSMDLLEKLIPTTRLHCKPLIGTFR